MPHHWSRDRYGKDRRMYYDPIKILDDGIGLRSVMREPLDWWSKNLFTPILNVPEPRSIDKWDLFAEYPYLEEIDYNRLVFEKVNGIWDRNQEWLRESQQLERSAHWEYCCWPIGCLVNSALGSTQHWTWRRAFEKQLPYWPTKTTHTH